MSGNSFGKIFKVTTFGESHGPSIGCVIDGCPSNLDISEEIIQKDLDRRKPGKNKYVTQRKENDIVKIISGVFEGKTTGTPITLIIQNEDAKSKDYDKLKDVFRPGHGDYSYYKKYGIRDYRGGGRASARETAARVAAGAVARSYLKKNYNIEIKGFVKQIGEIVAKNIDEDFIDKNEFFFPEEDVSHIKDYIMWLRKQGTSVGAKVVVNAKNVPSGLGEPVFDKLDASIAHALMGIGAVKAVAIGEGFDCVESYGHNFRDEITKDGFVTNYSGGILAGISTGQTISATALLKPTSSILKKCRTINKDNEEVDIAVGGRHDPCVGIRAVPIVEAMIALVLMDQMLLQRAKLST